MLNFIIDEIKNEQDMGTIITAIIIALVSSFSRSFFDKIFKEKNPDWEKLISNVKKFFLLILRYVFPIMYLIYVFIFADFDKLFIITNAILISLLFSNMLLDGISIVKSDLNKSIETISRAMKLMIDNHENGDNSHP